MARGHHRSECVCVQMCFGRGKPRIRFKRRHALMFWAQCEKAYLNSLGQVVTGLCSQWKAPGTVYHPNFYWGPFVCDWLKDSRISDRAGLHHLSSRPETLTEKKNTKRRICMELIMDLLEHLLKMRGLCFVKPLWDTETLGIGLALRGTDWF